LKPRGKAFPKGNKLGKKWVKGGPSPNPGGRPALTMEHRLLRENTGRVSFEALQEILEDPRHPRREQAAEYGISQWQGAPANRTELTGGDGKPLEREFPEVLAAFKKIAGEE
jgi:hypothetical protein